MKTNTYISKRWAALPSPAKRTLVAAVALLAILIGITLYRQYAQPTFPQVTGPKARFIGIVNKQIVTTNPKVQVQTKDPTTIAYVAFYLDDKKVRVDTQAPFCLVENQTSRKTECGSWETGQIPKGIHQVTAFVTDNKNISNTLKLLIQISHK